MNPRVSFVGRVILVASAAATSGLVRGDAADEVSRKLRVSFDVLVTDTSGVSWSGSGMTYPQLAAGAAPGRVYLTARESREGGACRSEVVVSLGPPHVVPGEVVWAAEARVRNASLDAPAIDLWWTRIDAVGGDGTASAPEWERVAPGPGGGRVQLDFVPRASSEQGCVRSFALLLDVTPEGDPGLEDRLVEYQVWLVHEAGGAVTRSRQLRSSVGQGTGSAFRFPTERLVTPSGAVDDPGVQMSIEGDVRGWVRRDGAIDLLVETRRVLALAGGGGSGSEIGRKAVTVASGEAVSVTLPDVVTHPDADPRLARALAGHTFSLLLVARREP